MSEMVDARLRRVFERLFGQEAAQEIASRGGDSHDSWDSIAHINLILMVEQEFGIMFSPEEAGMTTSFEAMSEVIVSKVGSATP